ncbi:hypothetical protein Tco_1456663 [Tanacetum coccineum]
MAPRNSTILLNTKVSLKGLSSASLEISHSPGASSSPKSTPFTPNTDLVIPSPTAILAILQSITALEVAKNPLPTRKGVSGSFFIPRMYKSFNSSSFPMWTSTSLTIPTGYDLISSSNPKTLSARVLKGFESPNLQGRVNSPGLPSLQIGAWARTLRTSRLRCKSLNSSSRVGSGSSGKKSIVVPLLGKNEQTKLDESPVLGS